MFCCFCYLYYQLIVYLVISAPFKCACEIFEEDNNMRLQYLLFIFKQILSALVKIKLCDILNHTNAMLMIHMQINAVFISANKLYTAQTLT